MVEQVYWTFPDGASGATFPYPVQVLVYNYNTGTWAINDDSITVFGYFYEQISTANGSATWSSQTITWGGERSLGRR